MKLPFVIDRTVNMSLTEQMFQGLRNAIVHGRYKPGQLLPGMLELAAAAGVSEKVARHALARLAETGWCTARRGARSVVADRGKERLGRVLFFNSETAFGYYPSLLVETIRSRLLKADYRMTAISAYDIRKDGSSRILEESLKEHWELVVENGMRPGARKAIEESGWPFLVLGDGEKCVPSRVESCVGQIENRMGLALSDFVHACVKRGVRSVVQFLYAEGAFDASEMLAMPGVGCETVRIPRCRSQFDMYSRAYTAMKALLKRLGGRLPDVFLFTDDHLTQGAVLALMEHGVRVPEDVRVVTHSNRGLGPFWTKPFTRLEMNPVAHGAEIADAILAYLRTRRLPAGIVLGSEWTPGETF